MKTSPERERFSARLQEALKNADYSADSPTQLAREFNRRFSGDPITIHAARKWLVGEAIPTQEKLRALAQWLDVAADWLRFGTSSQGSDSGNETEQGGDGRPDAADLTLLAEIRKLGDHDQELAREFLRLLVRLARQRR